MRLAITASSLFQCAGVLFTPKLTPFFSASATHSAAECVNVQIVSGIFMPKRAVRLRSVNGARPLATQLIYPTRNSFQVAGIAAASVPTQVIQLHPFRNGSAQAFIDYAMQGICSPLNAYPAVALGSGFCPMAPATCWRTRRIPTREIVGSVFDHDAKKNGMKAIGSHT
jgi:hypothetical protein